MEDPNPPVAHHVTLTTPVKYQDCTGFRVARIEDVPVQTPWDPNDPRIIRTPWAADDPRIVRTPWPEDDARIIGPDDPPADDRFDVAPPLEAQYDEAPDPSERFDDAVEHERILAFRPAGAAEDVEVRENDLAAIEPPLAPGELVT